MSDSEHDQHEQDDSDHGECGCKKCCPDGYKDDDEVELKDYLFDNEMMERFGSTLFHIGKQKIPVRGMSLPIIKRSPVLRDSFKEVKNGVFPTELLPTSDVDVKAYAFQTVWIYLNAVEDHIEPYAYNRYRWSDETPMEQKRLVFEYINWFGIKDKQLSCRLAEILSFDLDDVINTLQSKTEQKWDEITEMLKWMTPILRDSNINTEDIAKKLPAELCLQLQLGSIPFNYVQCHPESLDTKDLKDSKVTVQIYRLKEGVPMQIRIASLKKILYQSAEEITKFKPSRDITDEDVKDAQLDKPITERDKTKIAKLLKLFPAYATRFGIGLTVLYHSFPIGTKFQVLKFSNGEKLYSIPSSKELNQNRWYRKYYPAEDMCVIRCWKKSS